MAPGDGRRSKSNKSIMSNNKDICSKCENPVIDEGLGCELCGFWFHISCLDITKEQYEFISSKAELLFVCSSCKNDNKDTDIKTIANTNPQEKMFNQMMEKILESNRKVIESNEKMAKANNDLNDRVTKLENQENSKIVSEKQVKSIVETNIKQMLDEKVNEAVREAKEIENRKQNLILVNVKENNEKDSKIKDKEVVEELLKKIIKDEEVKVEELTRLGEKKDNGSRLIRIKVQNNEIKRKILKNSSLANEGSEEKDPKKKIYINPDFTKKERELNKTLRDKIKAMPTEERSKYTIKSNKIVPKEQVKQDNH